ncbi:pyruvate dehydrogenase (acetyl-transferring), homodimeric type [soil metagenome]
MSDNREMSVTVDGMPSHVPDVDPQETREWLESLRGVVDREGTERARYILLRVLQETRELGVGMSYLTSTDYVNTIPPEQEPEFPGDEDIERRIRAYIRWNAAVCVTRAQRPGLGVGGHIATYASAASLYEVGFNHFFRGKGSEDSPQAGDQIYIQGHGSPGIYARSYLEGRLTEERLDKFRQDRQPDGLSSYPHPRLMPDYWEFPTVSMGLSAINSIYQARFNRYLHHRGITDTSASRVFAFLGDGEMREPEALGALTTASYEKLDNLTWIVNCNLQQLDGPVRGNGKVIQELESVFRGAGWNVIKVVWGRDWDELLAGDQSGELLRKMNTTPDGQFQTYITERGEYIGEHFFNTPALQKLLEDAGIKQEDLPILSRGGHDYRKVYAAFKSAVEHTEQPTVILAQTIKGWTLGPDFEARNATHQMKKLTHEALRKMRDRLYLDISDEELESDLPPYYHPGEDSEEVQYMLERRRELGGRIPRRVVRRTSMALPDSDLYGQLKKGSGKSEVATTMAFVRLLKDLFKHKELGKRFVPIIPDEARTFGMDSLFPKQKIYSPHGMRYEAVDRDMLLSYNEATDGQVIHEGITEAGSMGTFAAAGTSYATFGEPMIPVYVFYSMFGFQRTGDSIWSAADQRARGFLLGATAGRTTLNGEGLQHEDGQSHLMAATNPACVSYDPSFAFEIAVIVQDALQRMYGEEPEDVFYYMTTYNEPLPQPAMPEGLDEQLVVKGLYRYSEAKGGSHRAQVLASGSAMKMALEARQLLADDWDVAADVWSAPGWVPMHREALDCERWNRMHPTEEPRVPFVTRSLEDVDGPVVAVTDYQKAVPGLVARWVPKPFGVLGTDGFGQSDTRVALRRYFGIDAECITVAVLHQLAETGEIKHDTVAEAIKKYEIDPEVTTDVP